MIGSTLGHFKILEKLGEGGMGAVYRAKDITLGRTVAIKVLPPSLVSSPDRKARFIHEAKAASALNHPNIVTIYEIGSESGIDFIAMECVEGRTLAEHIPPTGLAPAEVSRLGLQIADGLAKAHQARIIHRDLKPANIMVTADGLIKILDFGLAKLTEHEPVGEDEATRTGLRTQAGEILGTVSYMSPEQTEGRPLDARSDIFSFGVVLYEMATGRRAFQKSSPTATMAAILRDSVDTKGLPAGLAAVVTRCLQKDAGLRFQAMAKVRDALQEKSEPRRRQWPVAVAAAAVALAAAGGGAWWWGSRAERLPPMKVVPVATEAASETSPAFSPDGTQIAYNRFDRATLQWDLVVKRIGGPPAQLLVKNVGTSPAWSPDGRSIAFSATREGKRGSFVIPAQGGPEKTIGILAGLSSLSWSPDGQFLATSTFYNPDQLVPGAGSIVILPAIGGEPKFVLKPNPGQWFISPAFHPTVNRLGFAACEGVGSLPKCQVMSVDLDDEHFPVGRPRALTKSPSWINQLCWSADGDSLVYDAWSGSLYLWQVDSAGGEPVRLELAGADASMPAISLRGNRAAFGRNNVNIDIWKTDERGAITEVIGSNLRDTDADYSPDGSKIVYASLQGEAFDLWTANSDGSNQVPLIKGPGQSQGSPKWSPDGKWIAFDSQGAATGQYQIWVVSSAGGPPRQLTRNPKGAVVPSWSRDGKHIYFSGEEAGRREIFRMPASGGSATQVTTAGGFVARESPDGKTLYFTKTHNAASLFAIPTADGGEERKVFEPLVSGRAFHPFLDGVYYQTYTAGVPGVEFRFHEFAGGKDKTIGKLENFGFEKYLSVSPDRKSILFSGSRRNDSDIMLIENFR